MPSRQDNLDAELLEIDAELANRKRPQQVSTAALKKRKAQIEREIERNAGKLHVWVPAKYFKLLVAEAEKRYFNVPPANRVSGFQWAIKHSKAVLDQIGITIPRPAAEIARDVKRD